MPYHFRVTRRSRSEIDHGWTAPFLVQRVESGMSLDIFQCGIQIRNVLTPSTVPDLYDMLDCRTMLTHGKKLRHARFVADKQSRFGFIAPILNLLLSQEIRPWR